MEQLATPTNAGMPAWTNTQLIVFRFLVAWFLLYIFFNPNGILPGVDETYNFYIVPFHRLIPWIGQHILRLSRPITIFTNGSGDTTYDFVTLLLITFLSLLACAVWSAIGRRRPSYTILYYWVVTILRYYLAITMLSYGFAKVFKTQFPAPGPFRLLEPYGESTPMGLAWTFMGYSNGYNLFTGFAEIIPGTLLFFRRTTALGAFLAFIVSLNISAMNYCFDIPVKLLSTTMVLMSLFLLGDNIRRLFNLFFRKGTTSLHIVPRPAMPGKALPFILVAVKCLVIGYAFYGSAWQELKTWKQYGDRAPHTPLFGIYNTRSFLYDQDTLPPLQTDTIRWKQLVIAGSPTYGYASIKMMNDSTHGYYSVTTDTVQHLVAIKKYSDSTKKWRLHYTWPLSDSLTLWGTRFSAGRADSVRIVLARYPIDRFPLNARGFNWINEFPNNR